MASGGRSADGGTSAIGPSLVATCAARRSVPCLAVGGTCRSAGTSTSAVVDGRLVLASASPADDVVASKSPSATLASPRGLGSRPSAYAYVGPTS